MRMCAHTRTQFPACFGVLMRMYLHAHFQIEPYMRAACTRMCAEVRESLSSVQHGLIALDVGLQ